MQVNTTFNLGDQVYYMDDRGRVYAATIHTYKIYVNEQGKVHATPTLKVIEQGVPRYHGESEERLFKTPEALTAAAMNWQNKIEAYTK